VRVRLQYEQVSRLAATRPPRLLAERGDRTREECEDRRLEPTDVYPQLQGVGGHDPRELAAEQLLFDETALARQVPAPIGSDLLALRGGEPLGRPPVDQFGGFSAAGEDDR